MCRIAVLATVALGTLAPVAPARAQADPIGGVIVIPGSGSDLSAIRVRTSAGCPARANAYYAKVKGKSFPPDGQVVTSNTKAGLSHSFGFDAYFLLIMRDYATRNHATLGGRYDITVFCVDSFTLKDYGEFTGSLEFTSPTRYEALGAAKPLGLPPPPLEQAADGSAIAPEMALPPDGKPPVIQPPGRTAQGLAAPEPTTQVQPASDPSLPPAVGQRSSQRSAVNGQDVPWLVLGGVALGAGVVVAVTNRIRKRRFR